MKKILFSILLLGDSLFGQTYRNLFDQYEANTGGQGFSYRSNMLRELHNHECRIMDRTTVKYSFCSDTLSKCKNKMNLSVGIDGGPLYTVHIRHAWPFLVMLPLNVGVMFGNKNLTASLEYGVVYSIGRREVGPGPSGIYEGLVFPGLTRCDGCVQNVYFDDYSQLGISCAYRWNKFMFGAGFHYLLKISDHSEGDLPWKRKLPELSVGYSF